MDSIWTKTFTNRKRVSLKGDIRADVAVIGGGMTGILTAWQLKQGRSAGSCSGSRPDWRGTDWKYYRKGHVSARNVLSYIYRE